MKYFKTSLVSMLVLLASFAPATALAQVNVFEEACKSNNPARSQAIQKSSACQTDGSNPIAKALSDATRLIAFLAGVASIILIVVGGFMYVLSGGDSSKISTAKTTILYAVIGLVVIVVARSIIVFILNKFYGV